MYSVREITRFEYSWLKSAYFHNLYSQLTKSTLLSQKEFETWFMDIYKNDNIKLFGILYFTKTDSIPFKYPKLIGLASVYLHKRFYRNNGMSAHLEDVVIDKDYRGLGLGKKLINTIIEWCKEHKCYKIQLNCIAKIEPFYSSLGFQNKKSGMEIYFE